ncbi:hypothetical protein N3K63_09720 [Microbacterium sp. W1N]|uniref:hypothetical protein n=1 Tax=Microbacterium festucae TaxID=2977531 RepID=UPI0021BF4595|nr:hypothetical protein [Microbacterium festucae]MCT9820559.1 hypothetical protein [Microbacterium festucae]
MNERMTVTLLNSPTGVTETDVEVVAEGTPAYVWHSPFKAETFHLEGATLNTGRPVYAFVGFHESTIPLPGYPGA